MAEQTHISWADKTFSPWTGCTKVSPACDGCYAAHLMDTRMGRVEWGQTGAGEGTRDLMSDSYWREPLKWNRDAALSGVRPWVFPSLCDPFDKAVPLAWRRRFFDLMRETPYIVWLLLTKRPQNIYQMVELAGGMSSNIAFGTTVEDQKRARINIPAVLKAKRELKPLFTFLSCEPLLEELELVDDEKAYAFGTTTTRLPDRRPDIHPPITNDTTMGDAVAALGGSMTSNNDGIDWIIAGGETNQGAHKARETKLEWFRSLRDQAQAAGVTFHQKQITVGGKPIPMEQWPEDLRIQERPHVEARL